MAGLVPAIHVFGCRTKDVDARHKAGHDEVESVPIKNTLQVARSRRNKMTDAPVSPETGKPMVRGTRPMTISYKGQSSTFDMPGWFCEDSAESVHTAEDMKVSDAALKALKIKVEAVAER
jgi:YgiT-type zinc finger domain-containing protein